MREISDSLERALDRIEDFREVNAGSNADGLMQAVLCLQEAVELGDESRVTLRERLVDAADAPKPAGLIVFGIIVGLLAAQLEEERREHAEAPT